MLEAETHDETLPRLWERCPIHLPGYRQRSVLGMGNVHPCIESASLAPKFPFSAEKPDYELHKDDAFLGIACGEPKATSPLIAIAFEVRQRHAVLSQELRQ